MYSLAAGMANGDASMEFAYCVEEDKFYYYQEGYWQPLFEIELMSLAHKKYPDLERQTLSRKSQIIGHLKMLVRHRLDEFNLPAGWINLRNYMLKPEGKVIAGHDKSCLSTIRLDYEYSSISTCPLWLKTLSEIFEDNASKTEALQEYFGYCLSRNNDQIKALLLLGDSKSGKSTILHTLRHLLGAANCSSVPLKFISNPQYTPLLINRLVNIDADVSGKAEAFEAEFKIITSGEPVSVNQKFIPTFEFTPYCKLVLAANIFPRITDHSSAFYKRLVLIPCDRIFTEREQNRKLKNQLLEELPGILNWSLDGLERLNERGYFQENDFMNEAIEELREDSNPVEVFFKDNIAIDLDPGIKIDKSRLYKYYTMWCVENGNRPLSMNNFGQAVYRRYSKITPKDSRATDASRARVWKGLVYVGQGIFA